MVDNNGVPTQWDSALPLIESTDLPKFVAAANDQYRLAAYQLYDNIFRNVPDTFKLVARGSDGDPIYVPNAETIVEACNRYLAAGFDYTVTAPNDGDAIAARRAMDKLFRRNGFHAKFLTQKRWGLVRGDAVWHLVADPDHPDPYKRLKMYEVDPGTCFAITESDDAATVLGWLMVHLMLDPANPKKQILRRQKYSMNDDGTVQSEMDYYSTEAWDDRINPNTLETYQKNVNPLPLNNSRQPGPFSHTLPAVIDELPVYHITNGRAPQDVFGTSEIAGIERLIAAVNQSISDEELTLALDGLGLYFTTSGPPTDEDGNELNWVLGPGRVVEGAPDSDFKRVNGVKSVEPMIDHMDWITKAMMRTTGTSDTSVGVVDVSVAQSGIALALQMAPLLAKNREKETGMLVEYDSMFVDILTKWMPAYGIFTPATEVDITPVVDDPMPVNRAEIISEVIDLVAAKIMTIAEAQRILQEKLGIEFTMSDLGSLAAEESSMSTARDPFSARVNQELSDGSAES